MALWTPLSTSRLAEKRLWTPDTTFAFMGNDWSLFTKPSDMGLAEVTQAHTGAAATYTLGHVFVGFPAHWAIDATYANLDLTLTIPVDAKRTGGTPTANYPKIYLTIGGVDGTKQVVTDAIYGSWSNFLVFTWAHGTALPTGMTDCTLKCDMATTAGTNTLAVRRVFGERGPDCRFAFAIV